MRGPLTEIQNDLNKVLKLKRKSETTERDKLIRDARTRCETISKKIQMLLDFSRTEFEGKKAEGTPVNVSELAERLQKIRES
jgi:signal transduction histidine kinase